MTLNNGTGSTTLNFSSNIGQLSQLGALANNGINPNGSNDLDTPFRQSVLDANLNQVAGNLQLLDLLNREQVTRQPRRKGATPAGDEGVSVTYQIAWCGTSLPWPDRQLIRIASHSFAATFYKVATPLLSSYVYDDEQRNLSGGIPIETSERSCRPSPGRTWLAQSRSQRQR